VRLAALATVLAVAVLAASAWAFSSLRSGPSSWEPRAWPPTATASRQARCDKVASPRGSDRNPGTRRAPYFSAQKLADRLRPGQTGCLRAGIYRRSGEDFVVAFRRSGRPDAPITLRSYPGERARLAGITQIQGSARWIVLSGLDFDGDGSQNTIKVYGSDVTIQDSDITNRRRGLSCLILGSYDQGLAARPLIRRNRLHDCGNPANGNKDHAIYAAYTADGRITQNFFVNAAAYAIQFYANAQHTRFDRNVVDGGGDSIRGGIVFGGDLRHASSANLVDHNVIAFAATYGVASGWEGPTGSGNVVRGNCFWGAEQGNVAEALGFSAHGNVVADPEFRDRSQGDYRMPTDNRCRQVLR
jgi:Right handed beta helix region